ncbi:hypothetical protein AYL99_04823 [Fonsecaea erecta]|uniref:Uncharacterized protein n=1 Tax=Fonsecaea erecta TaxID=1367422 RepID=A0A178ZK13_9EURO|nr:hypothetical protein AYL99_04823 [Fonsecaea erecta]OAP59821.1 hypothetical protein AYL99_04823 [Fonsecaea erecta]
MFRRGNNRGQSFEGRPVDHPYNNPNYGPEYGSGYDPGLGNTYVCNYNNDGRGLGCPNCGRLRCRGCDGFGIGLGFGLGRRGRRVGLIGGLIDLAVADHQANNMRAQQQRQMIDAAAHDRRIERDVMMQQQQQQRWGYPPPTGRNLYDDRDHVSAARDANGARSVSGPRTSHRQAPDDNRRSLRDMTRPDSRSGDSEEEAEEKKELDRYAGGGNSIAARNDYHHDEKPRGWNVQEQEQDEDQEQGRRQYGQDQRHGYGEKQQQHQQQGDYGQLLLPSYQAAVMMNNERRN